MNAYAISVPRLCKVGGKHLSDSANEQRMRSTVRAVIAARASEQDAIRESHADEVRSGLDSFDDQCPQCETNYAEPQECDWCGIPTVRTL